MFPLYLLYSNCCNIIIGAKIYNFVPMNRKLSLVLGVRSPYIEL